MPRVQVALAVGVFAIVSAVCGGNPPPSTPDDLTALQGRWKPLQIEFEGRPQSSVEGMKHIHSVFNKDQYRLYLDDLNEPGGAQRKQAVMNVRLDPSTSPKTIYLGTKMHGIYELAGNQLKLCYGSKDKPKPTAFADPAKSGYFLEVWARQPVK